MGLVTPIGRRGEAANKTWRTFELLEYRGTESGAMGTGRALPQGHSYTTMQRSDEDCARE